MKQVWRAGPDGPLPAASAGREDRPARRRVWLFRVLAAGLAVAGVLLCGLAPMWAFRAQDEALFAVPHAYDVPVGELPLVPEDIVLVRRMYDREWATFNGEYPETNAYASQSTEAVASLLPRTRGYLNQLVEAGVLPPEVEAYLEQAVFTRPELNYSHYVESSGRETLNCNFGMGTAPPFYFGITVDMATDLVLHMELYLPADAPLPAQAASAKRLESYIAYLGLDVARDWVETYDQYDDSTTNTVYRRSSQLQVMAGYSQRTDEWQNTFVCWAESEVTRNMARDDAGAPDQPPDAESMALPPAHAEEEG